MVLIFEQIVVSLQCVFDELNIFDYFCIGIQNIYFWKSFSFFGKVCLNFSIRMFVIFMIVRYVDDWDWLIIKQFQGLGIVGNIFCKYQYVGVSRFDFLVIGELLFEVFKMQV